MSRFLHSSPTFDVVGIGAATWDDLWLIPDFNAEEGVTEALDHSQMGGGPVATALCFLASRGHQVALLDTLGNDDVGRLIREDLALKGVSLLGIHTESEARSACAVVMVRKTDGARQITYRPSNSGELKLDAQRRTIIAQAQLLHINGRHESAAREAVLLAQASGVTVSLDGGAGRYRDSIRDLVEQSHIRIVSLDFARRFCRSDDLNELMRKLLMPPAQLVVITDGTRGSHLGLPNGLHWHQPAYTAAQTVDTTGCGDIYHGAFLHGWLQKWPPQQCADYASQMAAKNAEGLGGRWVCQRPVQ